MLIPAEHIRHVTTSSSGINKVQEFEATNGQLIYELDFKPIGSDYMYVSINGAEISRRLYSINDKILTLLPGAGSLKNLEGQFIEDQVPAAGDIVIVKMMEGSNNLTFDPSTAAGIPDNAIAGSKIADDSLSIDKLQSFGDYNTFLRGDKTVSPISEMVEENIDPDPGLTANSNSVIPAQRAVKTYADMNFKAITGNDTLSPDKTIKELLSYVRKIQMHHPRRLLHVQHVVASPGLGGTFTAGVWVNRVLNTQVYNNITGASINTNTYQITLPEGTYDVEGLSMAFYVNTNYARLWNVTDNTLLILGDMGVSHPEGGYNNTGSNIRGRFTISKTTVLQLQHYCQTTDSAGYGFGYRGIALDGQPGIFADFRFWKVADIASEPDPIVLTEQLSQNITQPIGIFQTVQNHVTTPYAYSVPAARDYRYSKRIS